MHDEVVLIADDERMLRQALAKVLAKEGLKVLTASDGLEAMQILTRTHVDAAVLDVRMPGLEGPEVLARARRISPDLQVMIITAFASVASAVEAVKLGASEYVTKPLDFGDVVTRVNRLLERKRASAQPPPLRRDTGGRDLFEGILGSSPALMRALEMVRRLSQTTGSALITGESGTGKELIARAIHYNGPTAGGKFVAINCAALPETLVESELFGYCRGAFTGASQDKPGLFHQANGGTLLLDEVCAMPLHTQAKLLRFLETKEWTPVGGSRAVGLNARVLCSASSDIVRDVQEGRFRKDLYYLLNLIEIRLPPLRERQEDIPALAEHFVAIFSQEFRKPAPGISQAAIQAMMEYPWPGNIRELRNAIGRALILGDGDVIQPKDLSFVTPQAAGSLPDGVDLRSAVRSFQKGHILRVLRENGLDKMAAARAMGIGLSSLYRKMEELGLWNAAATSLGQGAPAAGGDSRMSAGFAEV